MQQMNVVNVKAQEGNYVAFDYKRAAEGEEQGVYQADNSTNLSKVVNKVGSGTGLFGKDELTHLVSTVRQQWDESQKKYQYQVQSYSSQNEYFVIDVGRNLSKS